MKNTLYLVTCPEEHRSVDYSYDSFVVSHTSEEEARNTHPNPTASKILDLWVHGNRTEVLTVQAIGTTTIKAGTVVIASYFGN
jgi:hypothetical protein